MFLSSVHPKAIQNLDDEHWWLLRKCRELCDGWKARTSIKLASVPSFEKDGAILTVRDIETLQRMVQVDFVASIKKELEMKPTSEGNNARPFDIYITYAKWAKHGFILVCLPFDNSLYWWNGESSEDGGIWWPVKSSSGAKNRLPGRKITNIMGTVRILQGLKTARLACNNSTTQDHEQHNLVRWTMNREQIVSVPDIVRRSTSTTSGPILDDAVVTDLNTSQRQAVVAVASFRSGFLCIQGPPGTGKTSTMVGMILTILQGGGSAILTAPSNAAVANVALKLYSTGRVPYGEMVVYGNNCDKSVHFLHPMYRSICFQQFLKKLGIEPIVRKKMKLSKSALAAMNVMVRWLHLDETKQWSIDDLQEQCPFVEVNGSSPTKTGRDTIEELISQAKVVFCTLNSSGSAVVRKAVSEKIQTFMLDEGGQCSEAEFFLAVTFPGIKRVVVMGDPKQLPPTVIAERCLAAGYGNSFLGQIYKSSQESVHLLDTQYRMDPKILSFPNQRFYNNLIQCGGNVTRRSPDVVTPFRFIDTTGLGREKKVEKSWQNEHEIAVINTLLQTDEDVKRLLCAHDKIQPKIIIVTPYKAQVKILQERVVLPKNCKALLLISTVDAFQGQEGDIVVVSTVRTEKVGFTDDPQRLNVALTRAKRILHVVGHRSFFETLCNKTSTLKALVGHASRDTSSLHKHTQAPVGHASHDTSSFHKHAHGRSSQQIRRSKGKWKGGHGGRSRG